MICKGRAHSVLEVLLLGGILPAAAMGLICFLCLPAPRVLSFMGMNDAHQFFVPVAYFLDHSLKEGAFPQWNPLVFCGTPFAGDPQCSVFYPPNLVRSLLTPVATPLAARVGLIVLLWGHIVFAGSGLYALTRKYGLGRAGAVGAALVWILSATFMRRSMAQWVIIAHAAWIPWLVLLLQLLIEAPSSRVRLRYTLALGLSLGTAMLAGYPQLTIYVTIFLGAYLMLALALRPTRDVVGEAAPHSIVYSGVGFAAAFVIGVGVAAILLSPSMEFAGLSARMGTHGGEGVLYDTQPYTWRQVIKYLVLFPGATHYQHKLQGAGAGALLLALFSMTHRNRRLTCVYGLLFLLLLDNVLGPPMPFSTVLSWLSPVSMSRSGRMILALVPLAILAGMGIDACARGCREGEGRPGKLVYLCAIAFGVLGSTAYFVLTDRSPFPVGLGAIAVPLLVFAAAVTCVLSRRAALVAACIPVLLFFEAFLWHSEYVPYLSGTYGGPETVDGLQGARALSTNNSRTVAMPPNGEMVALRAAMTGYNPLALQRTIATLGDQGEGGYVRSLKAETVAGANPRGLLFAKRRFWLARQFVKGPLPDTDVLFPPTTTVFVSDGPYPDMASVSLEEVAHRSVSTERHSVSVSFPAAGLEVGGDRARVLESRPLLLSSRHSALELRYRCEGEARMEPEFIDMGTGRVVPGWVRSVRTTGPEGDRVEIPLPDFEMLRITLNVGVIGPDSRFSLLDAHVLEDDSDEGAFLEVASAGANHVEVAVADLAGSRLLVFVEAAYPGWRAYVDGLETPIYRANDAFMAVAVPAGTHRVRFVFSSGKLSAGLVITAGTLLVCGFLVLLGWSRGRHSEYGAGSQDRGP
jgi:membrane protein YfhO